LEGNVNVGSETTACFQCWLPLIEIDNYGQRLIGCVECNRWTRLGSKHVDMQLPEDDIDMQLPEDDIDALRRRRAAKESLHMRGSGSTGGSRCGLCSRLGADLYSCNAHLSRNVGSNFHPAVTQPSLTCQARLADTRHVMAC
jgi:hypothetical protein